ncbi:hypothetical protein CMO93_05705 [Candidatus Woesearchaeota archaeon]|jgi:hypothetical protein|nr:hypothetical protein [Candidatus Woesearchaeota archaeon]|tara:strand:- start:1257 stop:1796 length:540 start_codon:yes stop_codon:yes gene_type:complete
MDKPNVSAFVMYVILLIVLLGLINMIFNLHRFAFIGEFLILMVLFAVAIVSVFGVHSNFSWAWKLLKIFFIFVFLDMVFIYFIRTSEIWMFFPLIITVVVGFFISFFNVIEPKDKGDVEEVEEVKTTHKPGKFIASKTGTKFHAPKCDWAKRVKEKNAVWFDSKEEAKKAGYKADSCVK